MDVEVGIDPVGPGGSGAGVAHAPPGGLLTDAAHVQRMPGHRGFGRGAPDTRGDRDGAEVDLLEPGGCGLHGVRRRGDPGWFHPMACRNPPCERLGDRPADRPGFGGMEHGASGAALDEIVHEGQIGARDRAAAHRRFGRRGREPFTAEERQNSQRGRFVKRRQLLWIVEVAQRDLCPHLPGNSAGHPPGRRLSVERHKDVIELRWKGGCQSPHQSSERAPSVTAIYVETERCRSGKGACRGGSGRSQPRAARHYVIVARIEVVHYLQCRGKRDDTRVEPEEEAVENRLPQLVGRDTRRGEMEGGHYRAAGLAHSGEAEGGSQRFVHVHQIEAGPKHQFLEPRRHVHRQSEVGDATVQADRKAPPQGDHGDGVLGVERSDTSEREQQAIGFPSGAILLEHVDNLSADAMEQSFRAGFVVQVVGRHDDHGQVPAGLQLERQVGDVPVHGAGDAPGERRDQCYV